MAILRCTKKLLSELKLKPEDPQEPSSDLSSWHANLLRIDRRKCVLFTHDRTLFSFLVPGLTKPDFPYFDEIFRQNLFRALRTENIPQNQIELVLDDIKTIVIAKTNSRSVLGSMNDLAFQAKTQIAIWGGLMNVDMGRINSELNRIPMGGIMMNYSIDELKDFLGKSGNQINLENDKSEPLNMDIQ